MSFITQSTQLRSKLKRKCKVQSSKSFNKNVNSQTSYPQQKRILTQMLQLQDYTKQIQPQQIQPQQIQTYGSLSQKQVKQLFNKFITKETLRHLIIDTLKLCYLYTPIIQAIETQLLPTRDEYNLKDVLGIIFAGHFYQYLIMKTQPTKFLFNNRTTDINVRTVLSAIVIISANKLTIKVLSDVVLFYRLEEALYQTAPHGLPFEFEKIIKAIKKLDRNITAQKFAKWQKRMLLVQKDVKYIEPYHFIYLMSLSEPMSKKKQNLFEAERRQSKLQKHSQLMSLMKEKHNFISAQTHKTNWKNEIKVRGLSFQHKSQSQHIKSMESEFVDLRRRIISCKRVKSAVITRKAVEMVKSDLTKNKQDQNQKLLTKEYFVGKEPQKQRTRLKKHNKLWVAVREFQACKKQQSRKFSTIYKKQFTKQARQKQSTNEQTRNNDEQLQQSSQGQQCQSRDREQVVDIYSHHLRRILANSKNAQFRRGRNLSRAEQARQDMLKWL